jgi:hypothetical protein
MTGSTNGHRGIHAVQFYEREPFLHRAIADHFAEPLRRGEPMVMVSHRRTLEAVAERLALSEGRSAADVANLIVFVDADAALSAFMDGTIPNPVRFNQLLARLIAQVRADRPDVRVWMYGEMVDVLCQAGNHAAAIRLEELWNATAARTAVSVLCG